MSRSRWCAASVGSRRPPLRGECSRLAQEERASGMKSSRAVRSRLCLRTSQALKVPVARTSILHQARHSLSSSRYFDSLQLLLSPSLTPRNITRVRICRRDKTPRRESKTLQTNCFRLSYFDEIATKENAIPMFSQQTRPTKYFKPSVDYPNIVPT